jgi:phage-related protein
MSLGGALEATWVDEYYETESGWIPVWEFIQHQDPEKDWPQIFGAIGMLNTCDGTLGSPYIESIEDVTNLWVLRVQVDVIPAISILYSQLLRERTHLLFHAFWSNSNEVPEVEVETAMRRMAELSAQARLR